MNVYLCLLFIYLDVLKEGVMLVAFPDVWVMYVVQI